jgi:hypothetical protein
MAVPSRPISWHHRHTPETDVFPFSYNHPPNTPSHPNDVLRSNEDKSPLKQMPLLYFSYVGYLLQSKLNRRYNIYFGTLKSVRNNICIG